jgi:hypothetical protein
MKTYRCYVSATREGSLQANHRIKRQYLVADPYGFWGHSEINKAAIDAAYAEGGVEHVIVTRIIEE